MKIFAMMCATAVGFDVISRKEAKSFLRPVRIAGQHEETREWSAEREDKKEKVNERTE